MLQQSERDDDSHADHVHDSWPQAPTILEGSGVNGALSIDNAISMRRGQTREAAVEAQAPARELKASLTHLRVRTTLGTRSAHLCRER